MSWGGGGGELKHKNVNYSLKTNKKVNLIEQKPGSRSKSAEDLPLAHM